MPPEPEEGTRCLKGRGHPGQEAGHSTGGLVVVARPGTRGLGFALVSPGMKAGAPLPAAPGSDPCVLPAPRWCASEWCGADHGVLGGVAGLRFSLWTPSSGTGDNHAYLKPKELSHK